MFEGSPLQQFARGKFKLPSWRVGVILGFSIALVVLVTWFVPALAAASLNVLFRLRGARPSPADIVIVAIDDQSLQTIGQRHGPWPWPRSVMASALDRLTQAKPRSIGLDVIYAEPSNPEDDQRLAAALARSGRVILPAQLYETFTGGQQTTAWLRPLPEFANAARAIGHAHISPEVDGMVRSIQLSKADDQATRLWSFSLEIIRAAEGFSPEAHAETPSFLSFGPYHIPVRDELPTAPQAGVTLIRQNEMLINFAGPAGTFSYYSIADVIDGNVAPSAFTDKIVLIGAVAESMGDSRVVPFMHYSAADREGGQEMPGVEIHANIINTVRNRMSLRGLPDSVAFAWALAVMIVAALIVHGFGGWRQLALLGLLLLAILAGSLWTFSQFFIVPPLAPMLTGFLAVIPLLLNRSLAVSRELDVKLAALVRSQEGFPTTESRAGAELLNQQLRLELPQSLAWKLRAVDDLTTRLLARMSFVNRILSSMEEGVLVADLSGRIVFANLEAQQVFDCEESVLLGQPLAELLSARGGLDTAKLREALQAALDGQSVQLELALSGAEPRHFSVLLSALATQPEAVGRYDAAAPATGLIPLGQVLGVVVLFSDITKRVELDRMKTETLQLVSHELRTPLTSIQGLSDVLLKFPVPAEESNEMLRTIHAEAVRLGETINRYLDLTRLESGAQPLRLTTIQPQQLLSDSLRNLSVFAADKRIRLLTEVADDVPALNVDAQLLGQALNNLVSNAIKYSPPATQVRVSVTTQAGEIQFRICDEGFGIPAEARDRIFQKFYRLERDANSTTVGTGLGLPLVKQIVEQHGGRISFAANADGPGTTFTFVLGI